MAKTLLRTLTISCIAALALGAAGQAFGKDRELAEATDFTGTFMFLGTNVPGLIFGAVRNGETALVGFGEIAKGSGIKPDENSIFRIGSISKVFCGTVLGALAIDGKVKLTDPLQAHINTAVTIPTTGGRTLELIDLVGQTSGLPREVARPNSPPENPFATNTREVLLDQIQKDPYLYPPGTSAFYSNFGYDLLGVALGDVSGKPYAEVLKERVLDPLGMANTMFNPPADAKGRLMQGHNFDGSPLPNVPTSAGIECSGGLHATGADMLRWINWNVDRTTKASPALRQLTQAAHVYRDGLQSVVGLDDGGRMGAMGLGWVITFPEENRPLILQKSGGLQGFFAYVAIAPTRGVGAFFVMNQFSIAGFTAAVEATNKFVSSFAPR